MKPQAPSALRAARQLLLLVAGGWTVVWLLFAEIQHLNMRREVLNMARVSAENSFQKDVAYRHWAAMHGGVYVPATKQTPPNPLLASVPERDIITPSGRRLTLVNPAYMTRQVHEWFKSAYGVTGHITSLKPANPINAADAWETCALKVFEKGAKEISSVETINGEPVLRFMRPFVTEKACLKCHAAQGYQEGDIRGGISLTVPLKPYLAASTNHVNDAWLWSGALWVMGLLGLTIGHRRMKQMIQQREEGIQHLRETQDRFRMVYDSMLEGMALHEVVCDANGQPCNYRFLQVNPAFERLTGLKAADIIGKTVREILPGIDPKWIERYGRVALTGESCQFEDYMADMDRHFEIAAFCPRKGQFAVTFSDVTERKRAAVALRESEEKFAKAFQIPLYAISITHLENGKFLDVNDAFTSMTGFTREEFLAHTSLGLKLWVHEEDRLHIVAALRAGRPVEGRELMVRKKNGELITVLFSARLIQLKDEPCVLSSALDITERKKMEEALQHSRAAALNMMEDAVATRNRAEQASEALRREVEERRKAEDEVRRLNIELERRVHERTAQLEMANKELEAFSYSVSHDLRAPLRGINGFANILAEEHAKQLDEESRRLLGIICSEASRMGQMIDELLTFARFGRQSMLRGEVDMTALAQSVFDRCAAQATGREVRLKLHPLPSAQGDGAMLSHVWVNLISNAIKYTRLKPVAEIEITGRADDNNGIAYCVKDNGAGFDMRYVHKLFRVFQRLHAETEFEGTGIGLALVQRIVQRHGGRVWAEGRVNEGAAFYFTLPIRKDELERQESD
ncbi:MAG: DUF3365 domain-containing protein [Verrucomicrobia bacterium]|nr:DUF3365 domain-containing protein [Verrucomicrobiota bacterium]